MQFLFTPARYKVAYGGRSSAKSHSYAAALIVKALERKRRILCTREIQSSIKQSVHKLLCDKIESLGLSEFFYINERSIKCNNGSEFIFEGLFRNVDRIKSMEDISIAWIEEGHSLTKESFDILTPTMRADDSEIWITFNPMFEDDFIYVFFVKNTPPDNAIVKRVNFSDNPWLPEASKKEISQDKERDIILYKQKWLGMPVGLGGKVWPKFDEKIHVRTFDRKIIADTGNVISGMDPHSKYYNFIVWLAIIPKNDRMEWPDDFYKHVYAEWPTFEDMGGYYHEYRKKLLYPGAPSDMAREIYAKDGSDYGIKVLHRYIDTRFARGAGGENKSTDTLGMIEVFAKPENGGLQLECPFIKHIDAQRGVIQGDMLYNEFSPISQYNEPTFSVDPSCKNLIYSLKNHRLEQDPSGGSREKEMEKFKDPSDALRIAYAGLVDFSFKNPVKNKNILSRPRRRSYGKDSWMK